MTLSKDSVSKGPIMTVLKLYTKHTCPFCVSAMEKLDKWGFTYTVIDVNNDQQGMQFLKDAGHRTVPQIYINNSVYVPDGCSGLTVLGKDGLEKLISQTEEQQ